MKKLIITIIFVVVVAAIGGYLYVFRDADTDVGRKVADYDLTAKELVEHFELNEDSANSMFLGKIISVEGVVDNKVEKDGEVTIYLKASEDISGVLCHFNTNLGDLGKVYEGENLKVKGICSGYLLDVVLNQCAIVNL